jgi:digalactosyldiacylglycerol synthase
MDFVTHALSGLAIGAVGAAYGGSPHEQLPLMLIGAAAAVMPDLDALVGLRSKLAAWRHHRVLLHGLPTLPLQGLALYLLAQALLAEPLPPGVLALTIAGGLLAHLLLDTVTSFGTVLGYPFTRRRFSTHSHFIIDPVVLGSLALGLALDRPALGLGVATAWLGVGVAIRHRLMQVMQRTVRGLGWDATDLLVEPGPLAPLRWLVVVPRGSEASAVATVSWRGQMLSGWSDIGWQCGSDIRAQALRMPLVQAFLATADRPHWEVIEATPQGTVLVLEDLKWRIFPPFRPMAFMVRVGDGADASAAKTKHSADEAQQMPLWWRGPREALAHESAPADGNQHLSKESSGDPPPNHRAMIPRAVVVTTAAPPWYTGTALNALHRARALSRRGLCVRLVFPWLSPADQAEVFPAGLRFASEASHAAWIRQTYPMEGVEIAFYPARWSPRWRSIFPAGPLHAHLPTCELLILEEPEHLQMLRPWECLRGRGPARRVAGILHTNYPYYLAQASWLGARPWVQRAFASYLNALVSRQCDRTIRLSPAVPGPANAFVATVNGVDERYFQPPAPTEVDGLYFIGKLIWEKGWREMLGMLGQTPHQVLHVFGSGDRQTVDAIQSLASTFGVTLALQGPSATPWADLRPFKILINCSRSEVLCSTTAEALSMGKFALVPRHPSNEPFLRHPNCLAYDGPREFQQLLVQALASHPSPVDPRPFFDWDTATGRLLAICQAPVGPAQLVERETPRTPTV